MMATPDFGAGTKRSALTEERSRRGSWRSIAARAGGRRRREMKRVRNRRKETGRRRSQKEIKLRQELLRLPFLLGLFSCGNKFANRTRMLAVECFDQRRFEWRGLGVAGDHRHPGDRLEDGPVSAQRKGERHDREPSHRPG